MSRYMLSVDDSVFITQKLKKCEVDLKKGGCSSKQGGRKQARDFHYDCKNFAILAKFSLCENSLG